MRIDRGGKCLGKTDPPPPPLSRKKRDFQNLISVRKGWNVLGREIYISKIYIFTGRKCYFLTTDKIQDIYIRCLSDQTRGKKDVESEVARLIKIFLRIGS
jgi:hypothetical protein